MLADRTAMGSSSFSQSMFTDLCERMLRLCKLAPEESLVVLSQGDERAEYVDAFLTAGQRLGARPMNLRLPYSSSATSGEVGHLQRLDRASARALTARARGAAKWALRASMHRAAPALARRVFTVHYACLCSSA